MEVHIKLSRVCGGLIHVWIERRHGKRGLRRLKSAHGKGEREATVEDATRMCVYVVCMHANMCEALGI
jgi:hypothetical protein